MTNVIKDLSGRRFGSLKVIEYASTYLKPNGKPVNKWLVQCAHCDHRFEITQIRMRNRPNAHNFKHKTFTLKKFSNDTKIPISTLRKWREQWVKVVSKLPSNVKIEKDTAIIRQIMKGMSPDTPAKKVIKMYTDHTKGKSREQVLINHHIQRLRGCMNAFTKDYKMEKFTKEQINQIFNDTKAINDLAKKALKPKVVVKKKQETYAR